jgi:hypothetical protein
LEHRASNPVSVKNLTAIETSTIVKLRPYVPAGTKRTRRRILPVSEPAFHSKAKFLSPHAKKSTVSRNVPVG